MIETAHILPGICASLFLAWISHGSVDRLHVQKLAFQLRLGLMQLVGHSWDQAQAALELLQGCACQAGCYLRPRSLSFLHRFGIRWVPLGTRPDCHPGRATSSWHRTEKVVGFEMRGHVAFGRVPGEREAQMPAAECRSSQISWRRHTLQAAATRPCSVKILYYERAV